MTITTMTRKEMRRLQLRMIDLMNYNQDTGEFTWKTNRGGARVGSVAGTINKNGYRNIGIDGTLYRAPRLAFLWMRGRFPAPTVDHINRNRDDNRWENLREASYSEQNLNQNRNKEKMLWDLNTYNGVNWDRQTSQWKARIRMEGKEVYLGNFNEYTDACLAREHAELALGYPEEGSLSRESRIKAIVNMKVVVGEA